MDISTTENVEHHRPIEVLHFDNYDAVLNLTGTDVSMVRSLAQEVREGIPTEWVKGKGSRSHIFIDSVDNPRHIAKIRIKLPDSKEKISSLLAHIRAEAEKRPEFDRKGEYARASVLNEITLSERLQELLSKKEATDIVKKVGFSGIGFIVPLLGLIDRQTGQRIVIYPYVKGKGDFFDRKRSDYVSYRFVDELQAYLSRSGISPLDIHTRQFIVSEENESKKLNLIDAEIYHSQ